MDEKPEDSKALDEEELRAVLAEEINTGTGAWSDTISDRRRKNMERYLGEAYGDEQAGYSQVVSRDVFEAVESLLPDLCEVFMGGEEVARVLPIGEEDEEESKLITKRMNYAFLCENPGFMIGYDWMKDALVQADGIVKVWIDEDVEVIEKRFDGLDGVSVGMVLQTGAEVISYEETPQGITLDVRIKKATQRIRIQNIPPEEFGIDKDARSLKDARCAYHITTASVSQLRELGFDEEKIEACPGRAALEHNDEVDTRAALEGGLNDDFATSMRRGAEQEKEIVEAYIWIDYDGDGKSELRRVIAGGRDCQLIFSNDVVGFIPFAHLSPIRIPHRFHGMSIADALWDLERIDTVVRRQYLDALYNATRPRHAVLGSAKTGPECDVDELDSLRPGGHVTEYIAGAIRPLQVTDATTPALQGVEFLRTLREERIGLSRMAAGFSQGTTESEQQLHGTAKGLLAIMASSNKRQSLIARLFAETGWTDLFQNIYRLLREIPETEFEYGGKWQKTEASMFDKDRHIKVAVGLGYGDRMERLQGAMQIASLQERIAAAGLGGILIEPQHVYNLADEICEILGYRNQQRFFANPEGKQVPQPPPEAWAVEIASKERIEAEKLRLEELKIRLEFELELRKLGLSEMEAEREAAETNLPLTGQLVPSPQSQQAAQPQGAQATQVPPPQSVY